MISLTVNGKNYNVDAPKDISLLWVLRDYLKLTGTKYGCGIGECGSCTVLIELRPLKGFLRIIRSKGLGSRNR
jgi:isoquinoline 1-oxidoreductase alpha subunit